jgi:hypothetical protein
LGPTITIKSLTKASSTVWLVIIGLQELRSFSCVLSNFRLCVDYMFN